MGFISMFLPFDLSWGLSGQLSFSSTHSASHQLVRWSASSPGASTACFLQLGRGGGTLYLLETLDCPPSLVALGAWWMLQCPGVLLPFESSSWECLRCSCWSSSSELFYSFALAFSPTSTYDMIFENIGYL
ncbi:hypothetical protein LIER_22886 [Lithospermum erythrorhizon]|uniref:Uncharacterized protein n=1 Tax=Lithospermum erythrorhizon TaxID=34254 RepID=A0AAV3QWQ3_LITER